MKTKKFLKKSAEKQKSTPRSIHNNPSIQFDKKKIFKSLRKREQSQTQVQSLFRKIITRKYYQQQVNAVFVNLIDDILSQKTEDSQIWIQKQRYREIQKLIDDNQNLRECYSIQKTASVIRAIILGILDKSISKQYQPISYGLNEQLNQIIKKQRSAKYRLYNALLSAKKSSNSQGTKATNEGQRRIIAVYENKSDRQKKGRFNKNKFSKSILNRKQFPQKIVMENMNESQSLQDIRFWKMNISNMNLKHRSNNLIKDLQRKNNQNLRIHQKQHSHKRVQTEGLYQVEQQISFIKQQKEDSLRFLNKDLIKNEKQYFKQASCIKEKSKSVKKNKNHIRHYTALLQYYDQPTQRINLVKHSKKQRKSSFKSAHKKSCKVIPILHKNPLPFTSSLNQKSKGTTELSPISVKSQNNKRSKNCISQKKQQEYILNFRKSIYQQTAKFFEEKKNKQKKR